MASIVEAKEGKKKEDKSLFQTLYPSGYRPYKFRWYDVLVAFVLFIIASIGYIKTVTPSVCAGDSGELTTAVYDMGACHPPGYALYGVVGKLFTFIPVGDVAYRMNIFSAIAGAGAVLFFYLILLKLLGMNRDKGRPDIAIHIPAIAGAFVFAFSMTQWSQAVIGEVYALNALLSAALLYLMIVWYEEMIYYINEPHPHFSGRITLLLAFIMGLSLTNHQLPVWYIAAWVLCLATSSFLILFSEKMKDRKFKQQLIDRIVPLTIFGAIVVISGILFYMNAWSPRLILPMPGVESAQGNNYGVLYVLIAIFAIPVYLTGHTIVVKFISKPAEENWVDRFLELFMFSFWLVIFAMMVYLYLLVRARAIAPLPEPKPLSWGDTQRLDILLNHMLRKQYGQGGSDVINRPGQIKAVITWFMEEFHWANMIFAVGGAIYLFWKDFVMGFFTFFAMALFSIGIIGFINFQVTPQSLSFQVVFFIQVFLIVALYIGVGYQLLLDSPKKIKALIEKMNLSSGKQKKA